jgi:uncharacterized protein involved in cysteine biosynthesis
MTLNDSGKRSLVRSFVLELLVYAVLVVGYFVLVLRLLGGLLEALVEGNPNLYGFVALGLIVAQGVLLEFVTSFLVSRLGLERLE